MDANTAILVGSLSASVASVLVAGIGAIAAVVSIGRSNANGRTLSEKVVPTIAKLEQNTNSMTAEIARLAKKEGEQIGTDRGRAAATAEEIARAAGLKEGQAQSAPNATGKAEVPPAADAGTGHASVAVDDGALTNIKAGLNVASRGLGDAAATVKKVIEEEK